MRPRTIPIRNRQMPHWARCAGEMAVLGDYSERTVEKLAGVHVSLENNTDFTEATSLSYNLTTDSTLPSVATVVDQLTMERRQIDRAS